MTWSLMRRFVLLLGAGLSCAGVVAGCASTPASAPARPASAPVRAEHESQGALLRLVLPDARVRYEHDQLRLAQERAVRSCMTSRGFHYPSIPPATPLRSDTATEYDAPVGASDYGLAHGVVPAGDRALDPADNTGDYRRALLGGESDRLHFTLPSGLRFSAPGTGCQAAAVRSVYGSLRPGTLVSVAPQDVRASLQHQLADDPAYVGALDAWRTCMRQRGLRFRGPENAVLAVQESYGRYGVTTATKADERAVATADVFCDERSGLRATTARLTADALARIPRPGLDQLRLVERTRAHAVIRLLGGSGGEGSTSGPQSGVGG
jgi:hypothetical protein